MNELNDTIKELIAKVLTGEASADEQSQLKNWIASDPANREHFARFKRSFTIADAYLNARIAARLDIDIDKEWSMLHARISKQDAPVRTLDQDGSNFRWMKIAATLLILVAVGFGIRYLMTDNITRYQTASAIGTFDLPDGSTVTMNRNSKLTIHTETFNEDTRVISFTGEGFFEIKPDRKRPFIIKLKNAQVEVVGTSFNILAYDSLETAEITVKTGIVKFSTIKTGKSVELIAGQKGTYSEKEEALSSAANDNVNFLSWNTREIIFDDTALKKVVETLNRTYQSNIIVTGNVSESCVVTVHFKDQSLDAILRVLENTLNITYTIKGDTIEISAAGC